MTAVVVAGCPTSEPAGTRSAKPPPKTMATPVEAKAEPTPPTPPAAPDGAVLLDGPWMYVQTCDKAHPCPQLKQVPAVAYCDNLELGDLAWRLPDRDEAKRFWTAEGLDNRETFHWTRTPYDEDPAQVWISDPKTKQETTLPKERRPFIVRCVAAASD